MIILIAILSLIILAYWFEASLLDGIKYVKKGKHRFFPYTFGLTWAKVHKYELQFHYGCKYDIGEDQGDINKLFGVGYWFHHRNSARIGWRYMDGRIEIMYYCYVNGQRRSGVLTTTTLNRPVVVTYTYTSTAYIFECNQRMIAINHSGHGCFGYLLGAYFGGNRPAPHEMKVLVKKAS